MSIKNVEVPFALKDGYSRRNEVFTGIMELGFNERGTFVVDAYLTPLVPPGEPRGTYFTALALSPVGYRRTHPNSNPGFIRGDGIITIFDDWGSALTLLLPNDLLDILAAECVANLVPPRAV